LLQLCAKLEPWLAEPFRMQTQMIQLIERPTEIRMRVR
jgi:hypothetical protein